MTEAKFTPGPWHAYPNPARDDGWFVSTVEMKDTNSHVIRDGAVLPYRVPLQSITFFQINREANARLIAAAPDGHALIVSLEWSADVDQDHGGFTPGCPVCDAPKSDGHADTCRLAAYLAKVSASVSGEPSK